MRRMMRLGVMIGTTSVVVIEVSVFAVTRVVIGIVKDMMEMLVGLMRYW
jgi:hypothetical protein